ncbi:MAG: hypothetical protein P8077_01040 [Gammaproteobacteria bacterium]
MKAIVSKTIGVIVTCSALSLALGAAPAMAGHDHGDGWRHHENRHHRYDPPQRYEHRRHHEPRYGKVIRSKPIYETRTVSVPRQECWQEQVSYRSSGDSATGTLLGSVIGASLGNELGHEKRNKQVGAVVGAVLGGSIAHDLTRHNGGASRRRTEQRCHTVYDQHRERTLVGYRVKYIYRGEVFRTRMDHHPGDRIRIR